jgi:hypothetical protein
MEAAVEPLRGLPESDHDQAFQPGRVTAAAGRTRRWRCRVCQVECGGRDVFRAHCGSDEHFDGLQVFGLRPDLFAGRLHLA